MLKERGPARIFSSSLLPQEGKGVCSLTARNFLTRPPLARRDVPLARARPFRFFVFSLGGVAKAALYCAHRTSTVLSCAFCEQEGHLAAPLCPFEGARCASKGSNRLALPFSLMASSTLLETGMAHLLEYVGSVHIYLGPYRGNPISLYLKRSETGCQIGPKAYPWNDVVGSGETPNKAAADFEEKWKLKGLSPDMYSGPSWEGGIKPEKPAPPKPPSSAKPPAPAPASVPGGQPAGPATTAAPADGAPKPTPALVAPPGDESS